MINESAGALFTRRQEDYLTKRNQELERQAKYLEKQHQRMKEIRHQEILRALG